MDQSSSLANALSKLPALNGLLSQLGDQLGGSGEQNDMFSNLLSDTDAVQSTNAAMTQAATVNSTATTPSSTGSLLQNLDNLSSALHTALNTLHQQSNNQTSSDNSNTYQPQDDTQSTQKNVNAAAQDSTAVSTSGQQTATGISSSASLTASASSTKKAFSSQSSTAVTDTTKTDSTSGTNDSSSTDTQTLAAIIAELMQLTQLMIKQLQNTGNAGTTAQTVSTSTDGQSQTAATTGTAVSSETNGGPLLQLLTMLQENAKKLLSDLDKNDTALSSAAGQSSSDQNALTETWAAIEVAANASKTLPVTASLSSDITQQLASIQDDLKQALETVGQTNKNTNLSVPAQPSLADTAKTATATAVSQSADVEEDAAAPSSVSATPTFGGSTVPVVPVADKGASAGSDAGSDMFGNSAGASYNGIRADGMAAAAEGAQATGTYSFASQLSAFRAANGGSTGLPSAVDQVILQLNRSVKNGNDQMSLQLQPGDLGKITVKLDFGSDGKVQGTVVADNPKTLDMLQKDSRSLERALQDAGLRADPGSLQFSLGGQQNQQNSGQATASNAGGNAAQGTGVDDTEGLALIDPATVAETYYITPGGVNIRV